MSEIGICHVDINEYNDLLAHKAILDYLEEQGIYKPDEIVGKILYEKYKDME